MPSDFSWATSSCTCAVSAGPSAAVGSSMIRILALKWTARAMATDWRCPPDSDLTGVLRFVNRGLSRCITFRVADAIAESSSAPVRVQQLAPEEHVAGGVDVVGQRELLVDRLDPVLPGRRAGCGSVTGSPLMRISPGVGRVGARQRVHQRRLAGAVAADEGDDLTGVEVDADAVDGVDAAEGHADVAHLDERDGRPRCDGGGSAGDVGHGAASWLTARPVWITMAATTNPATSAATAARRRPLPQGRVDGDRGDEHDADDDVLRRRVDLQQHHARAQRLHDDRTEHGAGDRADAAGERRAADDRGGDDVELVLHAEVGDGGVEPGRLDGGADARPGRP